MTEIKYTIKAVGDWELEVLGAPYGGPLGGKDSAQEYFDASTDFHLDKFDNPIIAYYHGFTPDGKPQGKPEIIGKAVEIDRRDDGVWYRVVLDKMSEYAKRVWEAAKAGLAKASSGSIEHMVRYEADGKITNWPLVELSLFDTGEGRQPCNSYAVALPVMKAMYEQAGLDWPESPKAEQPQTKAKGEEQSADVEQEADGETETKTIDTQGEITMDEKDLIKLLDDRDAKKAELEAKVQEEQESRQAAIDAAVKAELEKKAAEEQKAAEDAAAMKAQRLPSGKGMPYVTKYHETAKYDHLSAGDVAFMCQLLDAPSNFGHGRSSELAAKALILKLAEDKTETGYTGRSAMKAAGMAFKTDEVMQQDLTSYGDEWVGVAYSTSLWESIRQATFVLSKLPQQEVPQGLESIYLPLESTDPTWYNVPETEDHNATTLFPDATVTSSRIGTGRVQLTLKKMGARVPWSGELEEDSLIPLVSQLRNQLAVSGAEQLEHAIIDGDNATASKTNINNIGDSDTTTTPVYTMFDGFRVSPLVTTAANSRDGGVLTEEDYLETLKLMGAGGLNAFADITKVSFIQDLNTNWKALELAKLVTRDVAGNPTIENGLLSRIWGRDVYTSAQMHRASAARKANTSGKVDQTTTTNNTKGAILAVRWDQWKFGWRRRMTMETTRYPRSDSSEITAFIRCGMIQRDTEAAAITYNITV